MNIPRKLIVDALFTRFVRKYNLGYMSDTELLNLKIDLGNMLEGAISDAGKEVEEYENARR